MQRSSAIKIAMGSDVPLAIDEANDRGIFYRDFPRYTFHFFGTWLPREVEVSRVTPFEREARTAWSDRENLVCNPYCVRAVHAETC